MSNGFFHVSVQIARDWTGFWGFDGYFRCLCDIFEGMGGEGQYMLLDGCLLVKERPTDTSDR